MISDFFSQVASLLLALTITATPGVTVDRGCFPSVSPKPDTEVVANLGDMIIVPEISEANKDNVITASVIPDTEARSIVINPEAGFSKDSIVDWGPKNLGAGAVFRYENSDSSFRFETPGSWFTRLRNIKITLPASEKYWVTLKAPGQTIPQFSDQNIDSYGWEKVRYQINTDKVKSEGNKMYYVGGSQYPSFRIERINEEVNTEPLGPAQNYFFSDKAVTVKAGESFDIEVKTTGQGGVLSIDASGARILGAKKIDLKSQKSYVWKVFSRGKSVSIKIDIKNKCGGVNESNLEIPIVYDYKNISKEKVNIQTSLYSALVFGKADSAIDMDIYLQVFDGAIVVSGIPEVPLKIQAIYKDEPTEVVKNVFITSKGEMAKRGSATVITNKDGVARIKITVPDLTRKEALRGAMILKIEAPSIPGAVVEAALPITGLNAEVPPQSQTKIIPTF